MLTILFLGDVVGEPGRKAVIARLPQLKEQHEIDFTIVNGENAAGGRGITGKITIELLRAGVSVITTGDHVWDQKDVVAFLNLEPRLLRPVNYPAGAPGGGSIVLETAKGKVGVDVHGETTSEKIALGRFLDGKVSAVIGTHTHVQTADEQIFPGGTAFICDAGMCGPVNSILGRAIEPIMNRFISNLPASFPVAAGEVRLRGALIEIDESTGRAWRILRVDAAGPAQTLAPEPEPKIDIEPASSPEQT